MIPKKVKPDPKLYRQTIFKGWFKYQSTRTYKIVWYGEFAVVFILLLKYSNKVSFQIFGIFSILYVIVMGLTDYLFFKVAKQRN